MHNNPVISYRLIPLKPDQNETNYNDAPNNSAIITLVLMYVCDFIMMCTRISVLLRQIKLMW